MVRLFCLSTSLFLSSFGFVSSFSSPKKREKKGKKTRKRNLKTISVFIFVVCEEKQIQAVVIRIVIYSYPHSILKGNASVKPDRTGSFAMKFLIIFYPSWVRFFMQMYAVTNVSKQQQKKTKQKWNCCKSPRFRFRCVYGLPVVVKRVYFLGVC